jgi:AcrR family transcriptional regulator
MATGVKRRYESPRRREQAEATRRQILDAAQRLFEEQGYAATTMSAIADEAGVALKTVYVAFETKSGLLRALWHLLLRGDEADIPIPDRPWYRQLLAEKDPERAVRLGAHNARLVKERAGGVLAVIRNAAHSDPDVGELWDRIQTDFYENQKAVVERLHKLKGLKPGLGVTRGADLLWSLNHPDVWELLVRQRGWTPQQYESWLADTLCDQLLR